MPKLPRPVDWWQVVVDLCNNGHTIASIAISVGSAHTTVIDWKNKGATPRFNEGDALVELWCSITGNSRESVPRLR